MLRSSALFLASGKPSATALELCSLIKSALALSARGAVRLHLVEYGGRGRRLHVKRTEHAAAAETLVQAGVAFLLGNDAPRGGALGDFIERNTLRKAFQWMTGFFKDMPHENR